MRFAFGPRFTKPEVWQGAMRPKFTEKRFLIGWTVNFRSQRN